MTAKTDLLSEGADHERKAMTSLDINKSSAVKSKKALVCARSSGKSGDSAKNSAASEATGEEMKLARVCVASVCAETLADKLSGQDASANRNNNNKNSYTSGDPRPEPASDSSLATNNQAAVASSMAPTSNGDVALPDTSSTPTDPPQDSRTEVAAASDVAVTSAAPPSRSSVTSRKQRVEARVKANNSSNGTNSKMTSFSVRQATRRFNNSSPSRTGSYSNAAVAVVPPIASSGSYPPRPPTPSRRGRANKSQQGGCDGERVSNGDSGATNGNSANYFYCVDRNGDTILLNADIYSGLASASGNSNSASGCAMLPPNNSAPQRLSLNIGAANVFPALLHAPVNSVQATLVRAEGEEVVNCATVRRGSVVLSNCALPAVVANGGGSGSASNSASSHHPPQQQHAYQSPSYAVNNSNHTHSNSTVAHLPLASHNSASLRPQQFSGFATNQNPHTAAMTGPVRMMLCAHPQTHTINDSSSPPTPHPAPNMTSHARGDATMNGQQSFNGAGVWRRSVCVGIPYQMSAGRLITTMHYACCECACISTT